MVLVTIVRYYLGLIGAHGAADTDNFVCSTGAKGHYTEGAELVDSVLDV